MAILRGIVHINGLHLAGKVWGGWGAAGGINYVQLIGKYRWSSKAAAEPQQSCQHFAPFGNKHEKGECAEAEDLHPFKMATKLAV
jgi:hypothetical protein